MTVDLSKGATVELVKTLSDDIRTGADGTKYNSAGDAVRNSANSAYVVQSETGNPIYFDDGANIPVKELIVNLEPKQSGSGDPSPTNVRPITGFDGVTVKRTGKNLAQSPLITVYSAQNGSYSGENPSYTSSKAEVSPNTEYTLSFGSVGSITAIIYYEEWTSNTDFVYVGSVQIGARNQHTFTTPSNCHFVIVETGGSATPITPQTVGFVQIEKGSTATDYEPYQGQEYSITFPSSVGTVYGGKLNVTTGVLTVDRAIATITNVSQMNKGGATNVDEFYMKSPNPWGKTGTLYGADNIVCSHATSLESGSTTQVFTRLGGGQPRIVFPLSEGINSLSAFETWLNGQTNPLQFAYRIAEPLTYQLTPTEVSTLLGNNTIQSDGSMELDYRADTTKVIEKLTNAIVSLGGNV